MTAAPVPDAALAPATTGRHRAEDAELLEDRYRLAGELRRDAESVSLEAWDERLGRPVVVRLFAASATAASDVVEAIGRMPCTVHPGLVSLYDGGVTDGRDVFLVTEHLETHRLSDELADGPLSRAQVAAIGIEIADALAALHADGAVHGSVDLASVVRVDSEAVVCERRTKLVDAGVHRLLGNGEYASPEQVGGLAADAASDVYSLGLVLVALLTGRSGRLRTAGQTRLGAEWDELVHDMLATDPADRPTAAEVVVRLAGVDREPA